MTIRKVYTNNSAGTLLISIPIDYARTMGLTKEDNVNITLVGSTLYVTKVHLE